ncbi:MAG: cysteine--tRNA ligase [Gammaproteobacteria bacterium]|nr:cysteine--tRNA ligase [Gammaproteobacteria bacterium]
MTIRLYNSLTQRKQAFEPLDPSRVTMYVCGPTVYNHPHIGNARPPVTFDLLFKLLKRRYPSVVYARNITDLDDKINNAAKEAGVPITTITDRFTRIYHDDMAALGVGPPTLEPRATEHIPEMIGLIQTLIEKGNAYAADGHVLFHVPSYPEYGRLSRRDRKEMIAGARVEVAPYKKDPVDFVLWKPSSEDQPGWDSPWGRGRPGWHTECSTMIEKHLGRTIDIHAGGNDLKFPHHENEIAQTTCAHDGKTFARYWLHNGLINVNREKMSKSIGNVLLVKDLLKEAPGEAVRMALISGHYRKPLDWSDDTLPAAMRELDRLYNALREVEDVEVEEFSEDALPAAVVAALEDDLNTPVAKAKTFEIVRALNSATGEAEKARLKRELLAACRLLGIGQSDPDAWLERRDVGDGDEDAINRLVAARNQARRDKDFATADRIREQLAQRGVVLEDGPGGTKWRKVG